MPYDEPRAEQARLAAQRLPAPDQRCDRARELMKAELIVQERFNFSLAVFSFAVVGIPLGIRISRRETSANLGLALALVLSYYLLTVVVKSLDRRPELRPDLLIWLPNFAFIALGVWLFSRIDRR